MFDFSVHREPAWPEHLKPEGEGSFEKEDFDIWWARLGGDFPHLHPKILEQWVHRHWYHSVFAFLPLDTMSYELISLSVEEILLSVKRELAPELDPDFDYEVFQGRHGQEKLPTARALDTGTWEYPIIALSTPNGWQTSEMVNHERELVFKDERLMLVEGHQRHRYLNALHAKGIAPTGPHQVFVISSPMAN